MATLPSQKLRRLVQFCGMLGSDFAGERANAAKMASDLLREEKMTWEEVLTGGNGARQSWAPPPPRQKPQPIPWREQARTCLTYPDEISEWETEFLNSILRQRRAVLTPKQGATLVKIYGRLFDLG